MEDRTLLLEIFNALTDPWTPLGERESARVLRKAWVRLQNWANGCPEIDSEEGVKGDLWPYPQYRQGCEPVAWTRLESV